MKKLFAIALLALGSTLAQAAEVTVLDTEIALRRGFFTTDADAKFQMDKTTGEGFVKVSVNQERTIVIHNPYPSPFPGGYYPGGYPYPYPYPGRFPQTTTERYRVFDDTVKVDGLSLVDDKVIYQGVEGEVECGTLGVSRVFKVPTLYLNGNCKLTARVVDVNTNPRVVVKLTTK